MTTEVVITGTGNPLPAADDIRAGGYAGALVVANDLDTVVLG